MARDAYLLEQFTFGRWSVICGCPTSSEAQMYMRNYRKMFAKLPMRVVEQPSRRLVVCEDPTGEPFAA